MARIETISDEKALLRRLLRLARRDFAASAGPQMLLLHALAMARIAMAHINTGQNGATPSIAAYLGNGREVDALPALELAAALGHVTALPAIDRRGGAMVFRKWGPGDALVAGPHGIRQPPATAPEIAPHAILAPLVGFDRKGNRLGQGGGFYDRAFAAHPDALRIGLAWSVQEARSLPVDLWDLPLHGVVTEREWIDFR